MTRRPTGITRRRLLWRGTTALAAGGAALAGVELEVLPGKASLYHHLGHNGADGVPPDVEPGRLGRQRELDGIAVRVDCGKGDPFYATSRDYVEGFADPPAGGFQLGDHDSGYWRRTAPRVLAFLGGALAS